MNHAGSTNGRVEASDAIDVFVVFTPLHVLIAEAVMREEGIRRARAIVFVDGSDKVKACCERYFSDAVDVVFVPLRRDVKALQTMASVKSYASSLGPRVRLFTGSLKSIYSRMLLAHLPDDVDMNTFDDGYGSLVLDGYFSKPDALLKRLVVGMIGRGLEYRSLVSRINTHYSIYSGEHVYSGRCRRTVRVSIAPNSGQCREEVSWLRKTRRALRILLTQPLSERLGLSREVECATYRAAIDRFGIEFLLPHPADSEGKYRRLEAKAVKTRLIAEEVVAELAEGGPVELYSFGSTVLLNVAGFRNVSCYWLMSRSVNPQPPACGAVPGLHLVEMDA